VVNSGIRHGRDAGIEEVRAAVDVGLTITMVGVMATRGARLALTRVRASGPDPGASQSDAPTLVELDSDGRIAATVVFDLDDFDAAIAELDARYLAGEAAAHGHTWSVITRAYAAANRHELPATTPDWVNIDHRRGRAFGPGELGAYMRASWDLIPDTNIHIEAVHRLSNLGAVVTHAVHGTSRDGFDAEWRELSVSMVDGDCFNRSELFDEADLDAALAKFDQLSRPAPRLENAASQVAERFWSYFAAHDWDAMAELLTDDLSSEDRRGVVGAGIQHGRNALIADMRALADLWSTNVTLTVIATRGERLALFHVRLSGRDQGPGAFLTEVLAIIEIDADERMLANVAFDPDDFDAAFEELDARYLAGEAAAHARTWSVIKRGYAAASQHEIPAMTPDCVTIDHRRTKAFAPGELTAYIRAGWELDQNIRTYVEVVQRLSDLGAVCTYAAQGVSHEGFDAEWREVAITTVEGDMANRCELFDAADLDAALAKFEQLSRPEPRLENAASQIGERYLAHRAAGDWDAVAEILADNFCSDDRRRVVGAGVRHGRDALIADMRAIANLSIMNMTSTVMAIRGKRLVLMRASFSDRDQGPGGFLTEVLVIVEINADDRIVAAVTFDPNDFEAATAELDGRYLAGEAAANAHTWSVIVRGFASVNRHELPALTPDLVSIDHRRAAAYGPGELIAYVRAGWSLDQRITTYVESVHRLNNLGAVVTHAAHGSSQEGFDAEWRGVDLLTVDGDMCNRCEVFDEEDLDTAITKFDQLSRPAPHLENAASQVYERFWTCFAARDWDAFAELLADDISMDDRRRVVNAGLRLGRGACIADMRAVADVGTADNVTSTVIATRGERLTLNRIRSRELDTELLNLVELNSDERIIASAVVFDLDDIGAAFAELDARYLAGEAAAHTHTWSVITRAISALNRREMPPTTPDWVTIDHHRHGVSFGPGELPALLASWYLAPEVSSSIEVVHRLNDFGAVFSSASYETSQEGVNAEWRVISVLTVEGDLIDRFEAFDEADLDAALVRFDELCAQERRLENAASRTYERLQACFLARDWDVLTEMLAADVCSDDRRRGVNAGMRRGREAAIQDARAMTDLWITNVTSTVIATRGERLVLMRARYLGRNQGSEAFYTDVLNLIEIDADGRINARISFDANDVDAAFQELDAQYLAGEAAAYADMWSVITHGYATLNRHELPATTSDSVTVDHRVRARFEGGDLAEYIHSGWDVAPDLKIYIEAVYRLSNRGAVFTHVAYGTSPEGFDAEWRMIVLLEVGGDQVHRCELFDEADLDAALARFEELRPQMPRLENAASRADERVIAYFAARNWDGMAEVLADDYYLDDRRPVVNIGIKHGRDVAIADMQASAELELTSCPIATRSERLVLSRVRWSWSDQHAEGFHTEALNVIEINADERITARIWFDANAIGAAFEELDARYLAGEATVYAGMWSVITSGCAALNRHELPPNTSDLVSIDHRRGGHAFATGDLPEFLRATWELMPQARIHIEAVHRLSNLGAVVTSVGHGTSQEGFDAEWRMTELVTLEGGKINRCELFDEEDRDAALARFEELHPQTRRLENAASRVAMRVWTCFAARDWEAMAELFADDISTDDRRRVVNAGVFLGRDAQIANLRTTSELGANITSTVIATRGERLALTRICGSNEDFSLEMLSLIEVGADYRATAGVQFDPDDFETAFAELDARYLAGEAAAHSHAWSVIMRACAVFNRHELPPTTSDSVIIDHRSLVTKEAVDLAASVRAGWDLTPDVSTYIEAVHRLSDLGAVVTLAMKGTSQEGFDAEWRMIAIFTVQGELISCCEIFDEADLDAALARFEELHPHTPQLENAASQVGERYSADFTAGDWDAMAEILADDFSSEDRRRVVGAGVAHGRDAEIVDMRAIADLGLADLTSTVIAIRGERLVLSRSRFSDRDHGPEALLTEVLTILEINADERIVATVVLDPNDFDAAFEELDARYAAGEAAEHAHAWSVIARGCATFNRHEPAATTPDPIYIDHRPVVSIEGVDLAAAQRLVWDLTPVARTFIEAVHRLSELGAVVTHVVKGTSPEGFDAEWRMISILTVEGDLISRCEVFDEPDLDAALARFDELRPQARRLENNASRMYDRYNAYLAAREWDALAEMVTDDICDDDRRRVVSGGIRRGRDAQMANVRAIVGVGVKTFESDVIATRGERLALTRTRVSGGAQRPEVFGLELLNIIEIDTENRIAAGVSFDLEDIDAAFEELDSRYLAGEAAAHAHTWSLVTRGCAAFNRHEPAATTPDPVYIDHRPLVSIEGVDLAAAQRAVWDLTPDARTFIEAVHRLSELGAVVTQVVKGTSPEGFDAEWQMVSISTFEGDLISRYEVFDEADLDAALARFDELHPQARRLENAASQVYERFWAYSAAREWDAMAETLGDGSFAEDRRRVVSAGLFQGRGAVITMMRALADVRNITWTVMAIRGERLALTRFVNRRLRDEKFDVELLTLVEIDPDNKITAHIAFDLDDIDAALEELEARYLAGEAAEYAHTWSVIAQTYAAFNRHELPTTTPDSVYIDHRPLVSIETAGMAASARAVWDLTPDVRICIEAVHRLSELGAVATGAMKGTSPEGFEAEWQMINIYTVDGDRLSRFEVFGETDLDAALARFEELHSQRRELENAASRAGHRFFAHFRARNWAAIADALAEDTCVDDRRRVVNAGLWDDRDVVMANMQALAEGWTNIRITVIATRGERLALARICTSNPDVRHGEFDVEMLAIVEIDTYERVTAQVLFGLDDFDGAFAELDARYLAGEAADHSHAWSVIAPIYAAFNRHELPATDWVNIDHRRGTPFASSDPTASIRALWDLTPDLSIHIETVHRLSSFGAVVTHMAHGTSAEGFDAEWRMILLLTVESDRIKGCELFDEADLDAALARFDELQPQAPQLENAASRVYESYREHFAARDWVAMAELLTADTAVIDHRPVVNSGVRRGRDVEIANMQGVADIGAKKITSTVIATRGDRLALCRTCIWGQDEPEGFRIEFFSVVEIDAEERIVARVAFDPNDIDAAFEELDARYLAGEAAAHSHTWSVLARECAAFNRHELQAAEYVTLDHRQLAIIDATDPQAAMRAIWDVTPDLRIHIEEVHRLSGFGAVATYTAYGTSPEGFDAEWRMIYLLTVEGDRINRCEIFDEPDLDAALAHFEELHRQTRRLENKATRAEERFFAYYKARDWAAIAEILADDTFIENRTPVVNTPLWEGRDVVIANMQALADAVTNSTSAVVAIRGERLALTRNRFPNSDARYGEFVVEQLIIAEIDTDGRIAAHVVIDPDDMDAAIAELDARYLAGEAAAHAHTWSLVTGAYAANNRREIPPITPDFVSIDHRRGIAFEPGDLVPYMRATWDLMPGVKLHIETVHRLTNIGAVVTHVALGASQAGFDAEWRELVLLTFEGALSNHCEMFDEADLDAAIARFEELQPHAPRPENAASQVYERFWVYYASRDWDAMAEVLAEGIHMHDRRRVVNAGAQRGRDVALANMRAMAEIGAHITSTVIGTRGQRLVLTRICSSNSDLQHGEFRAEMFSIIQIDADNRIAGGVIFDIDDIDAAFEELDARYLAGEAAAHAQTWSVVTQGYAALNRHEIPPTTPDFVSIDHRRGIAFEPGALIPYVHATWDVTPESTLHIETVHRLTNIGAVVTHIAHGTSQEGFDAEWRELVLSTFEGDRSNRCEMFDEADLDLALARFEELQPPAPLLENAATRTWARSVDAFNRRDVDDYLALMSADGRLEDRRKGLGALLDGPARRKAVHALFEPPESWRLSMEPIAIRGSRLSLTRECCRDTDAPDQPITIEVLTVVEVDDDDLIHGTVSFDADDINAAFEELNARYLVGEAAAHAHTWSVISRLYAGFNRHELPATTPDWSYVDHRPLVSIKARDLSTSIRALWEQTREISIYMESIHRLSDLGAVVTHTASGTSQEGFDAEWRMIYFLTIEGDLISRLEVFDEADLDAALARFDELDRPAPAEQT